MSKFLAITTLLTTVILVNISNSRSMTDNVTVIIGRIARIFGGEETSIEDVPWMVEVLAKNEPGWKHICGGSIISEYYIVSAAHCFRSDFRLIHAGSTSTFNGGSNHTVDEVIHHPNTTVVDRVTHYDIVVVRVKESFEFDSTRQAVPIQTPNQTVPEGSVSIVCGWGVTKVNNPSTTLQCIEIPVAMMSLCEKRVRGRYDNIDEIFCAGEVRGDKDACAGDSGGPLTVNGILAGIVSWGYPCGFALAPSVYVNVSYLSDWIANASKDPRK